MHISRIPLILIDRDEDRRSATKAVLVRSLADSITRIGLLHPVVLFGPQNSRYRLIAGYHRLAAVELLGWAMVPAMPIDIRPAFASDFAEIIAMDEDLCRQELPSRDVARMVARRLDLYAKWRRS